MKRPSRGASQREPKDELVVIVSSVSPRPMSATAWVSASKAAVATGARRCPAPVKDSLRVERLNNATPSWSSSARTWWLTAACVTFSSAAALVKERCRAAASNRRRAGREGSRVAIIHKYHS